MIHAVELYDQIQEAVAAVKKATNVTPKVGVVLGSGLGAFAERVKDCTVIKYGDIPHFPESAVAGHAGELIIGDMGGVSVAVMAGRVHFYEGWTMQQVTFGVRVLAGLGAHSLLITNAAGASNPTFAPGDFMVIVDHINLTGDNPLRGQNDDRVGPRFPDMSLTYCADGRKALHEAARQVGVTLREGVYAGLAGPSYETPAEIRMMQNIGADAVGMSTVGEVIAAAHSGMKVAGLSVVTNRAAGLGSEPLSHEEVKEVGGRVRGVLCDLLAATVVRMA
jgi:purine-nucleoside phosphorylase